MGDTNGSLLSLLAETGTCYYVWSGSFVGILLMTLNISFSRRRVLCVGGWWVAEGMGGSPTQVDDDVLHCRHTSVGEEESVDLWLG